MLKLEQITEDNYEKVISLKTKYSQEKFLAPNIKSLADAYLYRNDDVTPFAVLNDEEVVGFILFDVDENDSSTSIIWRMMIDEKYQGNGYGKELLEIAKTYSIKNGFKSMIADYVQGNEIMKHALMKSGFYEDGIDDYNQVIMRYDFNI